MKHHRRLSLIIFVLFGTVSLLQFPIVLKAENITLIKTSIDGVQLYSNQALIRRKGDVTLQKGENSINISDLPQEMIDESVQVKFPSSVKVKLQEINVSEKIKSTFRSKDAEEAEKRLLAARENLRVWTDRYMTLQEEERLLKNLEYAKLYPTDNKKELLPLDTVRWSESLNFLKQSFQKNSTQQAEVLEKIDLAREELSVALFLSDRYKSETTKVNKELRLLLVSDVPTTLSLLVEYRIQGAAWFPSYITKVTPEKITEPSKVHFSSFAFVKNETGETWENIKLKFSTADPRGSADIPVANEWRIEQVDRVPPQRVEQAMSPSVMSGSGRKSKGSINASPEIDRQREFIQQQNITQQKSNSYLQTNRSAVKDSRANLRSKTTEDNLNSIRRGMIEQRSAFEQNNYEQALDQSNQIIQTIRKLRPEYQKLLKAELNQAEAMKQKSYLLQESQNLTRRFISPLKSSGGYDYRYEAKTVQTIPSDGIFHRVFLTNQNFEVKTEYESAPLKSTWAYLTGKMKYQGAPLLAGPMSLFYGDDYAGETDLSNVSANDNVTLKLGSDEAIRMERKENKFRSQTGILTSNWSFQYTVNINVENRKKIPITMTLLDRVPVSADSRIKIDNIRYSDAPSEKLPNGICKFNFSLAPFAKKKITIEYRITYPEGVTPIPQESDGEDNK